MIGQTINHYKITALLGAGGMGEVYLAMDTKLERKVALKFLPEMLRRDPEARERLLREARAASRLNHKNILTIHAVEEAEGRDFIVMEYVEGQTLKEMAGSDALSVDRILRIAMQIADGLATAHEAHVVHRDIKSDNIIVSPARGQLKIMDFGLATWRGAVRLTQEGSTVGTAAYMSPEQAQGREVDHRADLWSFGVVLYELLTGRLPFEGEHEAALAYAITTEEPEPLARYKSGLPPEWQTIISKALDRDPSTRYQSAADMLADLKRIKKIGDSGSAIRSKSSFSAQPGPQRHPLRKALVSTAAVALVALLVLVFKPWRFDVAPEQKAEAVENRLAVMYFDNLADPDDPKRLGEIAANLLITDLSESQYVQIVSSQRLFDILTRLGHGGSKRIDQATATEVAREAKARWMLLGSLLKTEPNIVITAQLVDVKTGNAIASQRINGREGEDIFALVDRLTVEVKRDLALPAEAQSEPDLTIAEGTTHSTEAYRSYLEGLDYMYKYYWEEFEASMRAALAHDSTFAMACYWLVGNQRGSRTEREAWLATAQRYSHDLPRKDRWYIEAAAANFAGEPQQQRAAIERIITNYPDEKQAYLILTYINRTEGRDEDAVETCLRLIEIDPNFKLAYNILAYLYNDLGDLDKSITAINQYIAMAPDEANPLDSRADLYAYNGKLDEAISSFRDALAIKPDFYPSLGKLGMVSLLQRDYRVADSCFSALSASDSKENRPYGRAGRAMIAFYQGRLTETLRILDEGIAADRMEQYEEFGLAMKHDMRCVILELRGEYEGAIQAAAVSDRLYRVIQPNDPVGMRPWIASLHAQAGEFARADSLLEAVHAEIMEKDTTRMDDYWWGHAEIAYRRGSYDEALASCARIRDPNFWTRRTLARIHLARGEPAEAIHELEQIAGHFNEYSFPDATLHIGVHYWLGVAYEQSGWTKRAIEKYTEFLDIWKDADDGITMIDDARERLARLKGEAG